MKTVWVDLSERNERDEVLLAENSCRLALLATGLTLGQKILVEDADFRVPGVVRFRGRRLVVKLDWDSVVYKRGQTRFVRSP